MNVKVTAKHLCLVLAGLLAISIVLFFMEVHEHNVVYDLAVRQQTGIIDRQAKLIEEQGQTIRELRDSLNRRLPVY